MDIVDIKPSKILVAGAGNLPDSIVINLLEAGHTVCYWTPDPDSAVLNMEQEWEQRQAFLLSPRKLPRRLQVSERFAWNGVFQLAILVSPENAAVKAEKLLDLEARLPPEVVIAVNAESVALDALQQGCAHPGRVMVVNWTVPACSTRFLEIVTNTAVPESNLRLLFSLAKKWKKDPYVVRDHGIRSRLLSAMFREAFSLVEQGYATIEDIDRACRNDAGYYLPFAGNCRYMDLMGTSSYAIVMKDLNPELSNAGELPAFFNAIVASGGAGMENGQGFYTYSEQEVQMWKQVYQEFSLKIERLIDKYPFGSNTNE
ncbi:3-hydroxyacyl-CoA dehydrogenase [Chitinophaga alhagiae]|uniref:3-hydroxyacyl-CoA dehydrogenase n=1 Tax=Chitinophaga alhagiae TaxID=2203219 RepID=A0ABM6W8V1_9BACT|nr:3-hydroxyacyl-CoA dehydrogenase family protein [Chitinophaga alhagiae]AWO00330.1 3-hydroxyacyl-CoA dehydrogenase [Chitinophaga alhagiae]